MLIKKFKFHINGWKNLFWKGIDVEVKGTLLFGNVILFIFRKSQRAQSSDVAGSRQSYLHITCGDTLFNVDTTGILLLILRMHSPKTVQCLMFWTTWIQWSKFRITSCLVEILNLFYVKCNSFVCRWSGLKNNSG